MAQVVKYTISLVHNIKRQQIRKTWLKLKIRRLIEEIAFLWEN